MTNLELSNMLAHDAQLVLKVEKMSGLKRIR